MNGEIIVLLIGSGEKEGEAIEEVSCLHQHFLSGWHCQHFDQHLVVPQQLSLPQEEVLLDSFGHAEPELIIGTGA